MSGRDRPDLLERLRASLGLGADEASAEMLRRLQATAQRLKLVTPVRVAVGPAPAPIVLRGVVVTEPRIYERRRLQRRLDRLTAVSSFFVWSFSVLSSLATILLFFIMLMFISSLLNKDTDDVALVAGLGGELNGVKVTPEKGDEDKAKEAEKGPDEKEDPEEKDPTIEEKAEKVEEKNKVEQADVTPQQGEVDSTEKKSVVTEAKTFSSSELESIIAASLDSVGSGPSVPAPRPAARDLGRLISEDLTKAVEKTHGGTVGSLRKGKVKQIVVVGGEYDQCEGVLETLRIPHSLVQAERFMSFDLSDTIVVVVNCDGRYSRSRAKDEDKDWEKLDEHLDDRDETQAVLDKLPASETKRREELLKRIAELQEKIDELRKKMEKRQATPIAKKLREFVKKGGYVMTTDWALTTVESAFPGYVYYTSRYGPHRTAIKANDKNREHPLLKDALVDYEHGLQHTGGKTISWYVDAGSYLFDFDESRVTELIRGTTLPTYKALAVTFRPYGGTKEQEGGRVLHVLGHFKEQGDAFGDFVLESLFFNFVKERIEKGE